MMVIGIAAWVLLLPAGLLVRRPPVAAGGAVAPAPSGEIGDMSAAQRLPHAAIRGPGGDLLPVLRRPFRADLPHGQLRHHLRRRAAGRRHHLQRRRPGRPRRAPAARHPGRPPRRQARAGGRAAGAGGRHRRLSVRRQSRRVLPAGRDLRHCLWRRDAALRRAGARVFRPGRDGHRVRRGDHGLQHRHGARAPGRRLGVRHLQPSTTGCSSGRSRVGLGAVAIALAFPPLPSRRSPQLQPA